MLQYCHPLLYYVPVKVIQHDLFCTGHFNVDIRGDQLSRPFFQLDPSGLLSTKEAFNQFNSESDKIDLKYIKMDDYQVPGNIWNKRLFNTYPKPKKFLVLMKIVCGLRSTWMNCEHFHCDAGSEICTRDIKGT